jgi:16S rRNA (adenine1518-N6/adenine1519-N6)-dimethyltransferase
MKDEGGRMRKEKPETSADRSETGFHPSSVRLRPATPKRRLGQNFLVDKNAVERIISAVDPQPDETIIEIGPGRGALTSRLAEQTGRLIAIEFDRELAPQLRHKFSSASNLEVIEADALTFDFCQAIEPATQARVVANLPYNIGTAILQRLIAQRRCISEMTLMLQREVVDRMMAQAGSSERGYLSVMIEAYCEAERLFDVSPQSFRPAPKVWSSIVRLHVRQKLAAEVKDEKLLWQVVSAGFAHPRKTILNNLREAPESLQEVLRKHGGASIVLCEACLTPLRRAETFTFEEWALLVNAMA